MRMIQIRQALPPPSHSVAYSQLMCPCGSLLSLCLCLCLSVSVSLSGAGGDSLADGSKHSPGKGLFKAAGHAVEAVNFMLDHEIQPFSDDSQVVQVAKEKWGSALTGVEGQRSAKQLKKALGYVPKEAGSNKEPSGANASVNRTTCKTKVRALIALSLSLSLSLTPRAHTQIVEEEKKVRAIRWVVEDQDDCFDRTSVHHPEHYARLLHGTAAHSQVRSE